MTLRELLMAQGVAEDVIAKIEAAMKEQKIFTAGEENLDIRYGKLKGDHKTLEQQHKEATDLIEQLKKSSAGDADTQKKFTDFEAQVQRLEGEKQQLILDNAIRFELLSQKAKPGDVDYLMFRMKQGKNDLKVTEDGSVKGLDAAMTQLKASCASNFEAADGGKGNQLKVDPLKLPQNDLTAPKLTRTELLKNPRKANELFEKDPDAYKLIMHGATTEAKEGEGKP